MGFKRMNEVGPGGYSGPEKVLRDEKKKKKPKFGKITTKNTSDDEISVKAPAGSMMADKLDNTDFQKEIKGVKTSKKYPKKAQAKRAFLAGLIHKMTGKSESSDTANEMIDLVLEGYDPFDIVEKFPFKKKKCKDDEEDDDE